MNGMIDDQIVKNVIFETTIKLILNSQLSNRMYLIYFEELYWPEP